MQIENTKNEDLHILIDVLKLQNEMNVKDYLENTGRNKVRIHIWILEVLMQNSGISLGRSLFSQGMVQGF